MKYNIKDKIEWTVIFLTEFGKRHGLTLKQSLHIWRVCVELYSNG